MEFEEISISCILKHQSKILVTSTYDFKVWLESLLSELHIPYLVTTLLCDNLSVIMLSHNPILHARTEHIELDIHFVCEMVVAKQLLIQHVPTRAQIANVITKQLSTALFSNFWTKLKVSSLHTPWVCGGVLGKYLRLVSSSS